MMSLPSITLPYTKDKSATPRIYVIQVYPAEINTDSNADPGDPIASIIVERTEEIEYLDDRKTISSARIRLSYELISTRQNYPGGEFCGSYSVSYGGNERVSITSPSLSTGAVFMDLPGLKGHRIGTYLMDQIVAWVKNWPNANLCSIGLSVGQADEENRERRNRFYEQFGIVFDYTDESERTGISRPMTAWQLVRSDRWMSRIKVINLRDYISLQLASIEMQNSEMEREQRVKNHYMKDYEEACKAPVKFLFKQWWYRYGSHLVILSVLSFIVAVFWHKY
jgi:GNAT superfamily N-acetyltransferase